MACKYRCRVSITFAALIHKDIIAVDSPGGVWKRTGFSSISVPLTAFSPLLCPSPSHFLASPPSSSPFLSSHLTPSLVSLQVFTVKALRYLCFSHPSLLPLSPHFFFYPEALFVSSSHPSPTRHRPSIFPPSLPLRSG